MCRLTKYLFAALIAIAPPVYPEEIKTPHGTLRVVNDSELALDEKLLRPSLSTERLGFKQGVRLETGFAVLVSISSGGTACPEMYKWVVLGPKDWIASPEFGTCSDIPKSRKEGSKLVVELPDPSSGKLAKFTFDPAAKVLSENGKSVRGSFINGSYSARVTSAGQPLSVLFATGGSWVGDDAITRSNQNCSALLAQSNLGLAFEKYEANQMTIQVRIGGRHPNRSDPNVQRMLTSDIRVPIRIENVKTTGNKVIFDRISTNRQGAVMGETYELDASNKVIRMLKAHTCQNCGEAELRSFRNRQTGGSEPRYWCVG